MEGAQDLHPIAVRRSWRDFVDSTARDFGQVEDSIARSTNHVEQDLEQAAAMTETRNVTSPN